MLETTASDSVPLSALGDQPRLSESMHARRARFHQSWYRAARLGVPGWGQTRAGRPLGSILPTAAATTGKNFTSAAAQAMFMRRRAQGWGVDPVRMTSHMTSSQTLLMNLLGPLAANSGWLLEVLKTILKRPDFSEVLDFEVEFAPPMRSRYLGDMTRVDAFVKVHAERAVEGLVLELKYTDRFSTRRLPLAESPRYRDLAESTALWRSPGDALSDGAVSQLLRCHALGARTLQVEHGTTLPVTLLLVSHPLDPGANAVFDRYRGHLTETNLATSVDLEHFLEVVLAAAPSPSHGLSANELQLRYLRHDESESLWQEHLERTYPTRRR